MPAPSRVVVLFCAALAVVTPLAAGALSWGYFDEARRGGALYVVLYWPVLLLDALPPRAREVLTDSALPMVLLYFAGYLLAESALSAAWRALGSRRRGHA